MAKSPSAKSAGRNSMAMAAVIVLLLSLVGAGAGFAVGALLAPATPPPVATVSPPAPVAATGKSGEKTAAAPSADAAGQEAETPFVAEVQVPMIILQLPPLLTNLAEPKETWVRFEGALLLKKETDDPSAILVEHAGEQILTFLRSVKLAQLAGPSGFLNLRDDLNDTVSAGSHGQVKEVLIHTMVLE